MQSASFEDCSIETSGNHCSGCSVQACRVDWYTNHTFIPGPVTLPDDMYLYLDCLTGEKTSSAGTSYIYIAYLTNIQMLYNKDIEEKL